MSKIFYKASKRFLDVLVSLILLISLSPLLLLVSFLIWLQDGHEVFVKNPLRLGWGGKEFKMYKFRSMIPDAHNEIMKNERYADLRKKWLENDGKLPIAEDIRISKIGKIIRKTDIDELPQLLNVIKGDMSLVGPRPMYQQEIDNHLNKFPQNKKYVEKILNVRPGITGLWQVSGRNDIHFEDRMKLEAEYASNSNLLLDLTILLRTPYVVLTRRGAYE